MKVLLLCGNHPRHLFVARRLAAAGYLSGLGVEQREAHVPTPSPDLSSDLAALFRLHFAKRDDAEARHFGEPSVPDIDADNVRHFQLAELNTDVVTDLIDQVDPDILLSYGVHKLTPATLSHAKIERWNLHGGLSPQYRGVITHFWPSYMLEPQMTGMTMHDLSDQLDAGDIVHQVASPLVQGDGLHDLAARSVLTLADELPEVLDRARSYIERGETVPKSPQKGAGKLWLGAEWRPEHLRQIYKVWDDRIVDACLEGKITGRNPELIRFV